MEKQPCPDYEARECPADCPFRFDTDAERDELPPCMFRAPESPADYDESEYVF